jgi:hypothetical protein
VGGLFGREAVFPVKFPPFDCLGTVILSGLPAGDAEGRADGRVLQVLGDGVASVLFVGRVSILEVVKEGGIVDGSGVVKGLDGGVVRVPEPRVRDGRGKRRCNTRILNLVFLCLIYGSVFFIELRRVQRTSVQIGFLGPLLVIRPWIWID